MYRKNSPVLSSRCSVSTPRAVTVTHDGASPTLAARPSSNQAGRRLPFVRASTAAWESSWVRSNSIARQMPVRTMVVPSSQRQVAPGGCWPGSRVSDRLVSPTKWRAHASEVQNTVRSAIVARSGNTPRA